MSRTNNWGAPIADDEEVVPGTDMVVKKRNRGPFDGIPTSIRDIGGVGRGGAVPLGGTPPFLDPDQHVATSLASGADPNPDLPTDELEAIVRQHAPAAPPDISTEDSMRGTPSQGRIDALQHRYDEANKPLTGKQRLFKALATIAPTALGAIFGGSAGATGAAEGTVETGHYNTEEADKRNKDLIAQIEAERGRQERQYDQSQQTQRTVYTQKNENYRQDRQLEALRTARNGAAATVTSVNPDGSSTVKQWNPATKRYDIEVGGDPKQVGKSRYKVTVDQGFPIVTDTTTGQNYDPADDKAPDEVKAVGRPFITAHNRHRSEVISDTDRTQAAIDARQQKQMEARMGKMSAKAYESALDADARLNRMEADVKSPNAQSDQDLLFHHIALTVGAVKGARLTHEVIRQHLEARSMSEELEQMYDRLKTGQALTAEQRNRMLHLGHAARDEAWKKFKQVQNYETTGDTSSILDDPSKVGGPLTGWSK